MTSAGTKPRRPSDLGRAGRKLWDSVADRYVFRPDELVTLAEACRALDELDRLRRELAGAPLIVEGSAGQPRGNPLLGEVRAHREAVARLLARLGIPDDDQEADETPAQKQARRAAEARWGSRRASWGARHGA